MPEELVIVLPDPALVVLVGAAGAGKTTFAARHFEPGEILSSDAFRAFVAGDEGDQAASPTAFAHLHRVLDRRMADRRTTVVDATNVLSHARRSLVRLAAARAVPSVAIVLDLPPTLVLARNATRRGRVVPENAVRRQLGDLARSLHAGRIETEAFVLVVRLRDPDDVARVRLVRTPTP